jgi:probable O-glycosylation ligase (exosortase A-associated)
LSYRDLVVLATVTFLLLRSLNRPFLGLLVFTWLAYMRPQDLCWGIAKSAHFSLFCAAIMFGGWFLYERRKFTRWTGTTRLLLVFIVCTTISIVKPGVVRTEFDRVGEKYFDLLKVFAVAYFTVGMVDTKDRLDKILWTIALSLAFLGVKCGLHGVLRGGRILQGPGGMMLDNNDLCLGMDMNLPLLFFLSRQVTKPWLRRLIWFAIALTCVTVVCTVSRGGFLTMILAGLMILWKLKRSVLPWIVVLVLGGTVPFLLPKDVKARLATLENPEEEGSAAGRLYAWQVGLRMIKANPFFGVGFEGFLSNFRIYDPIQVRLGKGSVRQLRVAHNTYVQVWAELGTPALLSFLGMLVMTVLTLRRTRREAVKRQGPQWMIDYADMMEVSIVCFMFGANFLNRAHFDLMYHLVALAVCLRVVVRGELAKLAPAPEPAQPAFGAAAQPALAPM